MSQISISFVSSFSKFLLILLFSFLFSVFISGSSNAQSKPLKIGVAGLTHDHFHWLFGRDNDRKDIEIVGIYEANRELWLRYKEMYELDEKLYYNDLAEMLHQTKPEAVTAFGSTYHHLELVQEVAPKGIHVMVEKPLAVNLDHAKKMERLAKQHNIHLITNYETTWYASNHEIKKLFENKNSFGKIRKVVVNDGHEGPKEIGVSEEFLEWLTDPVLNGGGAIMDFGCYGANLSTWLMNGEEPLSVTAITQTHKPDIYHEVDDEATIILTYPDNQAIIQASWNWPFGRKDMYVYGETGYGFALDSSKLETRQKENHSPKTETLPPREYPFNDPFSYLAAVVQGDIEMDESDLSSLENNMVVMKILEAAKKSAQTGETIYFNK
ncbi:MAG: Gfo/Idh/MocA family oxidoreductase, partial [Balneolaceae bacterium]|nr:Gfo/Idh/MocA family oxidoreductase [Balneolaceae bacterium]